MTAPVAVGSTNLNSPEYANIAYTTPPTTEVNTQDAMFGNYNSCVDRGRRRTDVRISKQVLVWAHGIYAHTRASNRRVQRDGKDPRRLFRRRDGRQRGSSFSRPRTSMPRR